MAESPQVTGCLSRRIPVPENLVTWSRRADLNPVPDVPEPDLGAQLGYIALRLNNYRLVHGVRRRLQRST